MINPNPKTYVVKHPNGEYLRTFYKWLQTTPEKKHAKRYYKKVAKQIAAKYIGGSIEKI